MRQQGIALGLGGEAGLEAVGLVLRVDRIEAQAPDLRAGDQGQPRQQAEGATSLTRAVLFVASSRIGHLTLMRQLGGTYALYDGSNKVVGADSDLYRLLGLFRGSRRPVH